nr:hypothetical protein [Tanacetum cinerariifolium]
MSNITHIKSLLTWKAFDFFCQKFHISEDVHPQLPSPNHTIHEMHVGNIGVYAIFFEYANFRLPLSSFLVDILRHYRIHISKLYVIAAAKVSHFEILCHIHNIEPTVGLFCYFYVDSKNKGWMSFSKRPDSDVVWNEHFFWVDSFACSAFFLWHTGKNVSKGPFPKSSKFSADDYDVLVAHSAPFRKFSEPFLCLIGISHNYTLGEDTYPTFLRDDGTGGCLSLYIVQLVKFGERERTEEQAKLLDSTVGRVVTLLLVAQVHSESKLEAKVERLFDEGGSVDQVDFTAGGGLEAETGIATGVRIVANKNVVAERRKPVPTLPMVTSSVSATPEREGDALLDFATEGNLRTIGPTVRFVIYSDSSYYSRTNASGAEVDSVIRPDDAGPSYLPGKELSMGSSEVDFENLHDVFVSHWNIPNNALLDDLDTSKEFIDHLFPLVLFAQIRDIDYEELFTEFSVRTDHQACLSAEHEVTDDTTDKGVLNFWLTAMKSNDVLADEISESDEGALRNGVKGSKDDANMLQVLRVYWYTSGDILEVVSLCSFEQDDRFVYMAFEKITGTLVDYMGKLRNVVHILMQLDKNGIIHGDVAPQHVLMRRGSGYDGMIKLCRMGKSTRIKTKCALPHSTKLNHTIITWTPSHQHMLRSSISVNYTIFMQLH